MKIGNIILSFLLVWIMLLNSLFITITYTYYHLDTIGFIERLCENQDKPELQCEGKCHLKKVSESKTNKQKAPENIIDFKELLLYSNPVSEYVLLNENPVKKQLEIEYQNLYSFSNTANCFHPPRL